MKPQIDESKVYTIGTDDGKVIEIKDTNLANGAVIQLWDEWDKPKKWQLWKFEKVGKYDDYRLINQLSGKMLDLIAEGTTNGSWAHQWERTDAQSQIWFLQPRSRYCRPERRRRSPPSDLGRRGRRQSALDPDRSRS